MFFNFATTPRPPRLACLGGGLMVDCGSEDRTYLWTCQNRYPLYAALVGLRCLLFVRDDDHVAEYQERIEAARRDVLRIRRFTGPLVDLVLPEPLFVACDVEAEEVRLRRSRKFSEQSEELDPQTWAALATNQMSPTVAGLLEQVEDELAPRGFRPPVDRAARRAMAELALRLQDKTRYLELVAGAGPEPLPRHVPTATFSSRRLLEISWEELEDLVRSAGGEPGGELFLKSALDGAGEVSVVTDRAGFRRKRLELYSELEWKVNAMGRRERHLSFLVQPRVAAARDPDPKGVGLTWDLRGPERFEPVSLVGHVYDGRDRQTFISSYLSDAYAQRVVSAIGEEKIRNLLRRFAALGYRGPINLDAVRGEGDVYHFVYDCNPRLGGAFPGLAVRDAFRRAGLRAETVLGVGYRGRFVYPELEEELDELDRAGLLYTCERQRGVWLLPNLVRRDSFDPILFNMDSEEMTQLVASGLLTRHARAGELDLKGLYL